jgi:hypothetical protein
VFKYYGGFKLIVIEGRNNKWLEFIIGYYKIDGARPGGVDVD